MPQQEQMLGRGATAEGVRRRDRGHAVVELLDRVDDNERVTSLHERGEFRVRLLGQDQHGAVR
jgi:hypothetical protein